MRIKQLGDPILRERSVAVAVDEIDSNPVQSVIAKIKTTLDGIKAISDENGNALSAPQVGHLMRIIVLRIDGQFVPMINPEYVFKSDELFDFTEECFSFYNLRGVVSRHKEVTIQYFDEQAHRQERTMQGEFSGLVQHEIDHLDGIFFVDRLEQHQSLQSIDFIFKDDQDRLKVVKKMCDYMAG